MSIQMKAIENHLPVVLFIVLFKLVNVKLNSSLQRCYLLCCTTLKVPSGV